MAIRPVDLQLAYLAAPQNAAVLSSAQEGPQAAQQSAAAAFAAEIVRREESVDEPVKVEGAKVRAREERDPGGGHAQPDGRRRRPPDEEAPPNSSALGLAGAGEHFIDVTA
ncbi:MAG TPA: hypothetical protein VJP85_08770 [Candidatus Baltobacteraceae bacterium]|nr:hypothetical protein [Candidatus Baltobacteraceae bacterium]